MCKGKREKRGFWRGQKFGRQMAVLYLVAVLLPMNILGGRFLYHNYKEQNQYYSDMLTAYNAGLKRTITEITRQIYAVSDSIVYNKSVIEVLKKSYDSTAEWMEAMDTLTLMDEYITKYSGIEEVRIYLDGPEVINYKQFRGVNLSIQNSDWYRRARGQYSGFWLSFEEKDSYGNLVRNLTLVRKMVLTGSSKEAVVMIKVKESYLNSRLENQGYVTVATVNDMPAFYSSVSEYRGQNLPMEIDYDRQNYTYTGRITLNGRRVLASVSTLHPVLSSATSIYVAAYDMNALKNIREILFNNLLILALAVCIPVLIVYTATRRFTGQVLSLRNEMHKASQGEYDTMSDEFVGSEELSEAFEDLRGMVKNIQQMEAEQYETRLKEQSIRNEQQKMEFKVLASQINPHFLYNTLEMIRMKAVTAGDREVATAIKLLGKSMRYVLENTGASDTTLKQELDHILTYLQIQQLRFGERVRYQINIEPWMDTSHYRILPLLLQPIVENAISHGLEGQEQGCIWIAVYLSDGKLHIDISDNGCGMEEETLTEVMRKIEDYTRVRRKSSIGLYNINRRIKLSYGEEYGITIHSTPGEGTRVSVSIPELYADRSENDSEQV